VALQPARRVTHCASGNSMRCRDADRSTNGAGRVARGWDVLPDIVLLDGPAPRDRFADALGRFW